MLKPKDTKLSDHRFHVAEHPYGKFRQPGSSFPFPKDILNDIYGGYQALADYTGVAPSGVPDRVGASDLLTMLTASFAPLSNSIVLVQAASQLSGTLDSTKIYVIDGSIDMGSTSITVPEGGLSIQGYGFGVSGLTSSDNNFTLFVTDTYSGDLFIHGIDLSITGTSSKVFDLDNAGNFNAVELIDVNMTSCTSLGTLDSYRQFLTSNVAFIAIQDGLIFEGAWAGGMAVVTTILINIGAGVTIFKKGVALTFAGSVRSDMNALSVNAATILFDFTAANIINDASFRLDGVRTSASAPLPNMSHTSTKVKISNCVGIPNTYVGAAWEVTSSAATTISILDTLYKMAGTTTYSEEHWFSNTTNNAAVYDSTQPIEAEIKGTLSFTGTNNHEMAAQLRHWDDSASAYVNIGPEYKATLNGGPAGTRAENISVGAYATLDQNDRIEVWIKNITAAVNITTSTGGALFINERPS